MKSPDDPFALWLKKLFARPGTKHLITQVALNDLERWKVGKAAYGFGEGGEDAELLWIVVTAADLIPVVTDLNENTLNQVCVPFSSERPPREVRFEAEST